jgi:methyl-accepting chemotaxis protein
MDKTQVDQILEVLSNAESDIRSRSRENTDTGRRSLLPRILFALIGCLGLANLYFVNTLTQDIKTIILSMNEMYEHFGHVSARMNDMRDYVSAMEDDIRFMPIIWEQMDKLSVNISSMRSDVTGMRSSVTSMDQRVGSVNASVFDMALRFRELNGNVGQMGVDVNQMSRPVP